MYGIRSWWRSIRRSFHPLQWATVVLLLAVSAGAQERKSASHPAGSLANEVQTVINTDGGLPQNSVHAIAQGPDHYLWFATEEGFARYDGVRVETYDRGSNPEIDNHNIRALAPAPDGSMWVASASSVLRFRNGRVLSRVYAGNVLGLFCDAKGQAWVGTDDGLARVTNDGTALQHVPLMRRNTSVSSIASDGQGGLWLLTSEGVAHLLNGAFDLLGKAQGVSLAKPSALLVARDGSLWIAGDGDLLHWSGTVVEKISLRPVSHHAEVSALLEDGGGRVWLGFAHDGIARLQDGTLLRYTTRDGLPNNDVATLQKDESGNVWAGLRDGGAVSLHPGLFRTYGEREGLGEAMVWATLAAEDGSVWIGLNTRGLDHLPPDGRVEHYSQQGGFPVGGVITLFEAADRTLWAGLDTGDLVQVTGKKFHVYPDSAPKKASLNSIAQAPGGDLYLLYNRANGLVRFHGGRFIPEPENIRGRLTYAVTAADGSLWVGSDRSGVTHWNGKVLDRFDAAQGLPSAFVSSIYVEDEKNVWVATNNGLFLIRNGRVKGFTPEDGLSSFTVGSVLPDGAGYLWMASNHGISKVRRQELIDRADGRGGKVHSILYGTADGMRTPECNYGTSPSASRGTGGRLWYATPAGITSIDPRNSEPYSGRPSAAVESLTVDGRPFRLDGPAVLGKGTHDLQVDFSAPDFVAPHHLQFRYRLDGFDTAWNDAGRRRQAFYTHLPPGRYTLRVQAEDGQGWPLNSSSLEITVPPHFWQTAWFLPMCGCVLLLTGYVMYNLRVYALRKRSQILQSCVVQRTAEMQEAICLAEMAQQKLHEQATRDSLTRLWNRRHIFELLQKEARRAEEGSLNLCVLMLDVDHFKHINDTVGHMGGDCVLEQIAAVLMDQTREYDYAGRYGGEEFLVVLRDCSLLSGVRRSEAIRNAIATSRVEYDGTVIPVTASFGVAEVLHGMSIEHALKEADRALYRAKRSGKNRVCSSLDQAAGEDEGWFDQHCSYSV